MIITRQDLVLDGELKCLKLQWLTSQSESCHQSVTFYLPEVIFSDVPDTIDQLVLNEDGTIKAATMPKLIQKLFDPDYNGMNSYSKNLLKT